MKVFGNLLTIWGVELLAWNPHNAWAMFFGGMLLVIGLDVREF